MSKVRTTLTIDEDVLKWVKIRAARTGVSDSAVIEESLRRDLKLDVLDELEAVRICTGYLSKGQPQDHPLANISHLKHLEPQYEELPGWRCSTRDARRLEELPPEARTYLGRIAELAGAKLDWVSVGAGRDQTIEPADW